MTARRDLIQNGIEEWFAAWHEPPVTLQDIIELAEYVDQSLPPEDDSERDVYQYARGLADGLASVDDDA